MADPLQRAIENLLVSHEREFGDAGYRLLMNRNLAVRNALRQSLLDQYSRLDMLLSRYGRLNSGEATGEQGPWLGSRFGWAEAVFTPLFMRFWCLRYYEDFELPDQPGFARVRAWEQACVAHSAAQQVSREEVVKLYYNYAQGVGNGALATDRTRSSFALHPNWSRRPWPPSDKYGLAASDVELGLC